MMAADFRDLASQLNLWIAAVQIFDSLLKRIMLGLLFVLGN
jgi:hypothetical protein